MGRATVLPSHFKSTTQTISPKDGLMFNEGTGTGEGSLEDGAYDANEMEDGAPLCHIQPREGLPASTFG
jgi:hypothetical protein